MDQFSTQLAMDIENGYIEGIPETLIQVYNDLSAWVELIQYKINEDINNHSNIRKKVLSHNLLIHVQDLWKQKVNEFYSIEVNEEGNCINVVYRNEFNNFQNMESETKEESMEICQNYDDICIPAEEEYCINNDLSSEEECCQNSDDISSEIILKDDEMVANVNYNTIPAILNVDVYEYDSNNNECNNNNLEYYKKDSNGNDDFYPTITSFPEFTESFDNDNSYTNDFLNTSIYNSDYEIYCTMDDNEKEKINIDQIVVNLNPFYNYGNVPDVENYSIKQLYESTNDFNIRNLEEDDK